MSKHIVGKEHAEATQLQAAEIHLIDCLEAAAMATAALIPLDETYQGILNELLAIVRSISRNRSNRDDVIFHKELSPTAEAVADVCGGAK